MTNDACPFMIRVFIEERRHNEEQDYDEKRGKVPECTEVQVHAWLNMSLSDLADLLIQKLYSETEVKKSKEKWRDGELNLNNYSEMSFKVVFTDSEGVTVMDYIGTSEIFGANTGNTTSLQSVKFRAGDMLDVALLQ
mmetsp:Transcript_15888/g.17932  ORF Transcript_15888/g.17932 Transcript_15888/m.17932 type:complete len:137 (+) Transcript_15888:178-588(+)|eukprot:CAMPEP_0184047100 /NCGR_PEP_ID=MMETSP0956-20121227/1968_1 /TAXON_ID=627963 /ORGANISM="Aplanochytrium sp, Strain PBS07" /LENGTH=136 /DNA_ID=CAMNT_0026338845 /DNA_START=84 /DNA_END=494 /DNA_ORIENTATION=+